MCAKISEAFLTTSLSLSPQIEKVLQQGDITEAVEPYLKARDLDKKTLEKHKLSANYFCQQLGQYRMPFAWTAINVLDIIAGTVHTQTLNYYCILFVYHIRNAAYMYPVLCGVFVCKSATMVLTVVCVWIGVLDSLEYCVFLAVLSHLPACGMPMRHTCIHH